jgi:translin
MGNKAIPNLDSIAQEIRDSLSATDAARETMLRLCREVIRSSSEAIRSVHRQEYEAAQALLARAASHLEEIGLLLKDHTALLNTGFVHDAQKEFAEGSITLALVSGQPIPHPQDLQVPPAAYLNGLGEAVGEMRRHLLDNLRRGQMETCEQTLSQMDGYL